MSRTRSVTFLAMALLLAVSGLASITAPVSAQSCIAQVSYPVTAGMQYYGQYNGAWNIQLSTPISATCNYSSGQLYAVGYAYDTVANANVGTANTVLNPVNGYSTGNLLFTLPPSVLGHLLQIQVSVYNNAAYGNYNGLVATTAFTVTIHPSYQYGYPNGYSNGYNYYYYRYRYYPYCYYNSKYGYVYYYNGYYYYYLNC